MARQLVFLATALVAALGQTDVSTCGDLISADGKCQNDSTALLQVALLPEAIPFTKTVRPKETRAKTSNDDSGGLSGPAGPKHQKDGVMTSMNDWRSSRDLARVWGFQNVTISPKWTVRIFSAVPVFGKDETYIALLVEHGDDSWSDRPDLYWWTQDFDNFVMFCAGPDGSHKTRVIARNNSWMCPWPREEWESKRFNVFLEDRNGKNLGMVVAEHDPKLLGQYNTMACVRDIFYTAKPGGDGHFSWAGPYNGAFKVWVEWMEWLSMHGMEQFLFYTFEGTDLAAIDVMKPYLDAGVASRVHFQFFLPQTLYRFAKLMNDCLYRAKNHAKWLAASVDFDEYMAFPGKVTYFKWDGILKEQGILEDKVASLEVRRVRFARARPGTFEISADHREHKLDPWPKQILKVDNVYRTSIHSPSLYKAGTEVIWVDPKLAIINHYRLPNNRVGYEQTDFRDPAANTTDKGLEKDMPLLEAAIAKRFKIQASAVKGFLGNLALRRPPDTKIAAAKHKMW